MNSPYLSKKKVELAFAITVNAQNEVKVLKWLKNYIVNLEYKTNPMSNKELKSLVNEKKKSC